MTVVQFAPRPGRRTQVTFSYSAVVVSVLKSTVPAAARSWDPAARSWAVDPQWTQALADELIDLGCTVRGLPTARRAADNGAWVAASQVARQDGLIVFDQGVWRVAS